MEQGGWKKSSLPVTLPVQDSSEMDPSVQSTREAFYEYYQRDVPSLTVSVDGNGHKTRTVVFNVVEAAQVLGVPPTYLTQYIGSELGCQSQFDFKSMEFVLGGIHDTGHLNYLLDTFIRKFVLCPECNRPETAIQVVGRKHRAKVILICRPCGKEHQLQHNHKFIQFVVRNPPAAQDGELSDQARKTRKSSKAGEKPRSTAGFHEAIVKGLNEVGRDLDSLQTFLVSTESKLNYRHNGEVLFEVLLTGGVLSSGAKMDGYVGTTDVCATCLPLDVGMLHAFAEVFASLIRSYRYLKKFLGRALQKVFGSLTQFDKNERSKLAYITGFCFAYRLCRPNVLRTLTNEKIVEDNVAIYFVMEALGVWKEERGVTDVLQSLRKAGIAPNLLEFFPLDQRSDDVTCKAVLEEHGLGEVANHVKEQVDVEQKLASQLKTQILRGRPVKDAVKDAKKSASRKLPGHQVDNIIWDTVTSCMEQIRSDSQGKFPERSRSQQEEQSGQSHELVTVEHFNKSMAELKEQVFSLVAPLGNKLDELLNVNQK